MSRFAILVIVDSLRFDMVADPEFRRSVAPSLDRLVEEGSLGRIVANASNTQFVMPSLLTGTYPLDHGGYNAGCKNRPISFPAAFRAGGFHTSLFSNCVLYNRDIGFDYGFETALTPVNSRRALKQDIEYRILPFLARWHAGEITDDAMVEHLSKDYGDILRSLVRCCDGSKRIPIEFPELARRDREILDGARRELAMLERDPMQVASQLASVPEALYWTVLGRASGLLPRSEIARVVNRLNQFWERLVVPSEYPSSLFDAQDILTEEAIPALNRLVLDDTDADGRNRLAVLHLMDVHTHRIPANQWRRSRAIVEKREAATARFAKRHGLRTARYLGALWSLDEVIGSLVDALKASGRWCDTALFISSDHGSTLPDIDRMATPDLPNRFEKENLEVPVIAAGGAAPSLAPPDKLFDSRDLGATLLSIMGLADHGWSDGKSMASSEGRDVVVSENGGRGWLDLDNDVLNFAITARNSKILARLVGSEIQIAKRWQSGDDANTDEAQLLDFLWRERNHILKRRGAHQTTP